MAKASRRAARAHIGRSAGTVPSNGAGRIDFGRCPAPPTGSTLGQVTCTQSRTARVRSAVSPAVAALVGSAATCWGESAAGTPGSTLVLEVVLGVLSVGLVAALPWWPVPVALAITALAGVAPTATPAASMAMMYIARERRFAVSAGVAGAGITAHLLREIWQPMSGLPFVWWAVLVVLGYAAFVGWGSYGRAHRAVIDSLRERADRAEAEQGRRIAEARAAERTAIAREMHDVLAHRLSLLATYAGALEYRPDAPPEQLATAAGVIRHTVHQALDELRDVIAVLREDTETEDPQRPVPALTDLPDLIAESRAVGTPVEMRAELPDLAEMPSGTARTAYRVVQEALTNARKHAPGQPVRIALAGTPGSRLVIEVRNPLADRAGAAIPGTATGLVGLTERVRLAGGQLDHQATVREFRLHAWLPWPG